MTPDNEWSALPALAGVFLLVALLLWANFVDSDGDNFWDDEG